MTFDEARERRKRHNFGLIHGDQDFRHGWNFALEAILDAIEEGLEKDANFDLDNLCTIIGTMGVEVYT